MIFKKILLVMGLLILSIIGVNAVTTLNNCGKDSAWSNGEVYVLNFSTITDAYANDFCFKITDTNVQNITFISQDNQMIDISKTGGLSIFVLNKTGVPTNYALTYSQFKNLKFNNLATENNKNLFFINDVSGADGSAYARFYFNNISNVEIYNFNTFFNARGSIIEQNLIKNITAVNTNRFYNVVQLNQYTNNMINDSLITINDTFKSSTSYDNNNFTNSIIIGNALTLPLTTNYYISSLISTYNHTDNDDDGVSDFLANANMPTAKIYIDKDINNINYRFVQDAKEGNIFMSNNQNIIAVNTDVVGNPTFTYDIDINSSFSSIFTSLLFSQRLGLNLDDGASIKNTINNNKMYMQDNSGSLWSSSFAYKGFIGILANNILIQDINFSKTTSLNNAHIISNNVGNVRNNITINENYFLKQDDNYLNNNNYIIRLLANNILITNNTFNSISNSSNGYEYLDIEGTNANSNKVTLNNFSTMNTTPSYIFTNNSDVKFYNNFIGQNMLVKDTNDLNTTPLVLYLHTNNNIYCFNVGNYYANNSACVDADGDGFCDSSYTNGVITDTRPLSSYPFNYASHLLTADCTILNEAFNITLQTPTDNQNFSVSSASSPINFSFSQDSEFIDLTCDFIIDGVSVFTETNPTQNTIYSQSFNGWANQTYTYRVECGNEFQYIISDEINFNVIISVDGGNGGGGNGGGGDGTGTGIIDVTDTQATADNVVEFAGSTLDAIMSFFSPFAMFFIIIVAILGIAVFLGA